MVKPGRRSSGPSDEDPFAVNAPIKQFLDKNVDRSADTLQQLRTLVHLVFEQGALQFTYQPVTRTAIETFGNHGGNCVSFTFLLIDGPLSGDGGSSNGWVRGSLDSESSVGCGPDHPRRPMIASA